MVGSSIYQQFLQAVWQRLKREHPYVKRFTETNPVTISKSASFLIGRSPTHDKCFILNFQYNAKPWGAGQFTINIVVCSDFSQIDSLPHFQNYARAESGTYRLGTECHGYDVWWCLKDRDRSFDGQMAGILKNFDAAQADRKFFDGKWRPSSFENPEVVIREALDDIFPMIEREVFVRFNFPGQGSTEERDFTDTDLAL